MSEPITAVLFDYHSTLVDQGEPEPWLASAWTKAARVGTAQSGLGEVEYARVVGFLDEIWTHGRRIDPEHTRDLSVDRHWQVFQQLAQIGEVPGDLVRPLWESMLDHWLPYDETRDVLSGLRARGVRIGVLSNTGLDLRPTLQRDGLDVLVDSVTQSWQVGAVKPDPRIFEAALATLDARPLNTLMVGDSWAEDGGAGALGVRVLILPRTRGPVHGLDAVLRLVV